MLCVRLWGLCCVLLCFSCSPKIRKESPFFENDITYVSSEDLIRKALYEGDDSGVPFVTLLEKMVYRLDENYTLVTQVYQVVQVLAHSKAFEFSKKIIYYNAAYEKIPHIEAYAMTQDGTKHYARVHDESPFYNDMMKLELYKDVRAVFVLFSEVAKGSVLYLRYQITSQCGQFCGLLDGEMYLKSYSPIRKQKLVVAVPKNYPMHVRVQDSPAQTRRISTETEDYYVFEQDDVQAIPHEVFQIPLAESVSRVTFSSSTTWQDVNEQFLVFFSSAIQKQPKTYEKALSLVKDLSSQEDKIKAVYEYVTHTKNIQNIAVPFGVRGYIPHSPDDVLRVQYADAQDKVALMIAMLDSVGVSAYVALMNEEYSVDFQVPSVRVFNRVLVAVRHHESSNEYLFFDPFSAVLPFNALPPGYYGKNVLVVRKEGPVQTRIPLPSPLENQVVYATESRLDEQGNLEYTSTISPKGSYETHERMRMIRIMLKNTSRSFQENYAAVYQRDGILLRQVDSPDPFDIRLPYAYSVRFLLAHFAQTPRATVNMDLHQLSFMPLAEDRVTPFSFQLPFQVVSHHTMTLHPSWSLVSLPPPVSITDQRWLYSRTIELREDTLVFSRMVQVTTPFIAPENYQELREFVSQIVHADAQMVELTQ